MLGLTASDHHDMFPISTLWFIYCQTCIIPKSFLSPCFTSNMSSFFHIFLIYVSFTKFYYNYRSIITPFYWSVPNIEVSDILWLGSRSFQWLVWYIIISRIKLWAQHYKNVINLELSSCILWGNNSNSWLFSANLNTTTSWL